MKNFIMFFYNLNAIGIKKRINGDYLFLSNNEVFILKDVTNINYSLEDTYNTYLFLLNNNIICNEIISTKEKGITSINKDKIYVLIKPVKNYKERINIDDIINYDLIINQLNKVNWRNLWIQKIDYYEYQVSQNSKKIPLISESFPYFEGLTENAIELLYDINEIPLFISHRRINYKSTIYDLYDPFNIIFDTRVRDITDYFKSEFMSNKKPKIIDYLNKSNLNMEELKLFYIRMMYPSFYFDTYDQTFISKNETKTKEIINMIPKYELLISELGDYINKYSYIVDIPEWLSLH